MADNKPRRPDRKLALIAPLIIGGVVVAIVAAFFLFEAGRKQQPGAQPEPPPPAPAATAPPASPLPPPPLAREDLIDAANAAAAAYSAGSPPPVGKDPLVGRQFIVRIPFGCNGPQLSAAGAQAVYGYNAQDKTLKLSAAPALWTTLPLVQALGGQEKIESVEGFWIPRPWTNSERCPPERDTPQPATPTPSAPPTLGLARIFETGGSRVLQRGDRPYEYVRKVLDSDQPTLSHTYSLVLEGRLVGFSGARAVRCWSESADHRPLCLYAVEFDRVAFEDGADGKMLAEWRE